MILNEHLWMDEVWLELGCQTKNRHKKCLSWKDRGQHVENLLTMLNGTNNTIGMPK